MILKQEETYMKESAVIHFIEDMSEEALAELSNGIGEDEED